MPSDPRGGDPSGSHPRRELFTDRGRGEEPPRYEEDYRPDYEEHYYELEPRRRSGFAQVLLKGGLAALAAGIFVGVVWYVYLWGTAESDGGSGELPVVYLDDDPEKVRPEEPGGMDVPHQDSLVLNQSDGTQATRVERLLPPPETPQPPQALEDPAPRAGDIVSEPLEAPRGRETPPETGEPQVAEPPPFEMPETPAAPSEAPESEAQTPAPEPEPEAQPEPEASPEPQPDPEPEPQPQAEPEATPSGFTVQLGAFRSEEAARDGWQRWQEGHSGILGDQRLILRSAEVEGQGTFWRVRTGPFPNRATAEDICSQLEARGQACLVVAPQ